MLSEVEWLNVELVDSAGELARRRANDIAASAVWWQARAVGRAKAVGHDGWWYLPGDSASDEPSGKTASWYF